MGIVGQPTGYSGCNPNPNYKQLTLLGRLQQMSACKEIIRQIPLEIQKKLLNEKDWLVQKTLSTTAPSFVFPVPTTSQLTKDVNGVFQTIDGRSGSINDVQPNFLYIMSDYPVKVTFGYAPDPLAYKYSSTGGGYSDLPVEPANVNMSIIVNGYFLFPFTYIDKNFAPKTQSEVDAWTHYSGYDVGDTPFVGSWADAVGHSESTPVFPIKVDKSIRFTRTIVKIYGAVLTS
jgi:hypothetical protein